MSGINVQEITRIPIDGYGPLVTEPEAGDTTVVTFEGDRWRVLTADAVKVVEAMQRPTVGQEPGSAMHKVVATPAELQEPPQRIEILMAEVSGLLINVASL